MKLLSEIKDWDKQWPRPVDPKKQWKVGRSAMELAKAFFRGKSASVPDAIRKAFRATPGLSTIEFLEGIPELTTALPHGAAGPRHHDVWLRARVGAERVGVGIEAKVDEPFDALLSRKFTRALKDENKRSKKSARYRALTSLVLRRSVLDDELASLDLRYQLVSGVAGTLIQAVHDGCGKAVFIVYELVTPQSNGKKLAYNQTDFDKFIQQIGAPEQSKGLRGPIHYSTGPHLASPVDLWIAKVSARVV